MRIALSIPIRDGGDWGHALQFASEAERMGAASLWSREAWGYDAVTPLAFLAARTSTIGLGTGIMQIGSRSPANVAMTATTLNSLSGGRFMLGLGTSGPQVIEGWHGIPFDRPIQRTRELIEIVRLATSGEQVAYEGEIYHLPLPGGEGRALRSAAGASHVPIYIAALGPRNLELTGELADGWMGGSFIPETAEVFIQHIRAGAEKSGRDLENFEIHIPLSVESQTMWTRPPSGTRGATVSHSALWARSGIISTKTPLLVRDSLTKSIWSNGSGERVGGTRRETRFRPSWP